MKKIIIISAFLIASFAIFLFSNLIIESQKGYWHTPIAVLLALFICSPAFINEYLHKNNLTVKNTVWLNIRNGSLAISSIMLGIVITLGTFSDANALLSFETKLGAGYATIAFLIILVFALWSHKETERREKLFHDIEEIIKWVKSNFEAKNSDVYTLYERTLSLDELRNEMQNETEYGKFVFQNFWRDNFMSSPIGIIMEMTG